MVAKGGSTSEVELQRSADVALCWGKYFSNLMIESKSVHQRVIGNICPSRLNHPNMPRWSHRMTLIHSRPQGSISLWRDAHAKHVRLAFIHCPAQTFQCAADAL